MGKNKKIVVYLLSFVLAVSIGVGGISAGIYCGFLYEGSAQIAITQNKEYENDDVISRMQQKLIEEIDYSVVPYGMDRLVFERILTVDIVKRDVSAYVNSKYYGKDFEPDYGELEESYFSVIGYIFNEKGIVLTQEQDEALQKYFNDFKDYYKKSVAFEGTKIFVDLKNTYGKSLMNIMYVAIAISVVLAVVLLILAEDRVTFITYSLFGGGAITMAVPLYLLVRRGYLKVWAPSSIVYDFYVTMIRNGLINIVALGGIFILAGFGFIGFKYFKSEYDASGK